MKQRQPRFLRNRLLRFSKAANRDVFALPASNKGAGNEVGGVRSALEFDVDPAVGTPAAAGT
ncbi:MAG: hypothetical protein ACOH1R_02445 [Luteimonas sp.]